MKKILTTALTLGMLTTGAHATEQNKTWAQAYQNFYQNVDTRVDDSTPWKDNILGLLADRYADYRYGSDVIDNSSYVTNEVKRAWTQGYDGVGVNIAVNDNFSNAPSNTFKIDGNTGSHGEHVTNIFKGKYEWDTVGIAPNANLIEASNRVIGSEYRPTTYSYFTHMDQNGTPHRIRARRGSTGIKWDNIDIIASSVGFSSQTQRLVDSHRATDDAFGTIIVNAAGNGGLSNYGNTGTIATASHHNTNNYNFEVSARHNAGLVNSSYSDSVLLVGALTPGGLNQGLHAGDFKDNYVVDYGSGEYGYATSWVAPKVAGKAALIKSKFHNLDAVDITNIIKNTADDLGEPGVDAVYGHGRVNLSRALSPIGSLR